MGNVRAVGVEKTFSKVRIPQQKSDFAYWQSQSYHARLAALEQIRREYHQWRYGAEPRLQKIYSIIIEGVPVDFIGLDDLRKNKAASGRYQDLADLENLK